MYMRTAGRYRRAVVSRGTRKPKFLWAHVSHDLTMAAGVATAVNLLEDVESSGIFGSQNQVYGATIHRIRGMIYRAPQTSIAAFGGWTGGIGVFPETAQPSELKPQAGLLSSYQSWMWRGYSTYTPNTPFANSDAAGGQGWQLDVRSKRKLQQIGQALLFVGIVDVGATSWQASLRLDVLLALH